MFYQLDISNDRMGCDNSKLPRVHLSVGIKEMDKKSFFNPKCYMKSSSVVGDRGEQPK